MSLCSRYYFGVLLKKGRPGKAEWEGLTGGGGGEERVLLGDMMG